MKDETLYNKIINQSSLFIQNSNNVKQNLLQFCVTINLAFFAATYHLLTKDLDDWQYMASLVILLVNISLYFVYIRQHRLITANLDQIKNVLKKINKNIFDKNNHPDWYKFYDDHIDKYKGLEHFIFSLLLIFFIILPIYISLNLYKINIVLNNITIALIFIVLLFYSFFDFNKNKKICSCINFRFIQKIIIIIIFISIFIILQCLFNKI